MRIGIDLGGTKIEIRVIDDDGCERYRRRAATPQGDYERTLATIAELVAGAERSVGGHCSVGVGTPGSRSPLSGRMRNANSTCLNGRPLAEDLEQLLARPVRLANDANCLALSEAVDGAGAGARVVFGVILGTGVGGGIVIDRRVWEGANGIGGEWGHNPLPLPGDEDLPLPACYCGRAACIETYLSGPGMVADHRAHGGDATDAKAVVAAAQAGDRVGPGPSEQAVEQQSYEQDCGQVGAQQGLFGIGHR